MKDDRLISLNAAIHVIKDALLSWSDMPEWRENKIVGALDKLPSAQKWIPCGERLPEPGVNVLVHVLDIPAGDCFPLVDKIGDDGKGATVTETGLLLRGCRYRNPTRKERSKCIM